jgi:SAM-dependent methyltransferase
MKRALVVLIFSSNTIYKLCRWYLYKFAAIIAEKDWENGKSPKYFKHISDLYRWGSSKEFSAEWTERGVWVRMHLTKDCPMLDLCCGDGFYPFYFYRDIAKNIDAVDLSNEALSYARQNHADDNINYINGSLLDENLINYSNYGLIAWNASLGYFTLEEQHAIFSKMKNQGKKDLILVGTTPLTDHVTDKNHKNEMHSVDQLNALLSQYFSHVQIKVTYYLNRENLVFIARL